MKTGTAALLSFVAVFAVVVAGGVVAGFSMTDEQVDRDVAPDHIEVDNPQYDADRVTSNRTPGQATVEMDSDVTQRNVVVHMGERTTKRSVTPLVNTLVEAGHNVTVVSTGLPRVPGRFRGFADGVTQRAGQVGGGDSELASALADAHGYIGIGVNTYSDEDLTALAEFLRDDGRAVMAVNPNQEFTPGKGLSEVYGELGAYTEPGYVYNLEENDLNYQRIFAEPTGDEMLTADVDRVVFDSATPVQASDVDERLEPIDGTELSVTRAETNKSVLVRTGSVALIGDTQFMTPENTQRADNDVFVGNVAEFLVEGDRTLDDSESQP